MGWPEKFNLGIQPKMNSNQSRIYKSMGQPPGSNNRDCFQSKDWPRVFFLSYINKNILLGFAQPRIHSYVPISVRGW